MEVDFTDMSVEQYEHQRNDCDSYINNLDDWSKIPTINQAALDTLSDGQFARYQGMVQDVLNPEFYYKNYNVKNIATGAVSSKNGKFLDVFQCKESEQVEQLAEDGKDQDVRQPLFCIPFPGVNNWVPEYTQSSPMVVEPKRSTAVKRPHPDDNMEVEGEPVRKVVVTSSSDATTTVAQYSSDKFFPIPGERGLACIVKHYGDRDDFSVNSRIEAVGFLSLNPCLEASFRNSDAEDRAMHPPPSIVPRLHALRIRKIPHCNPMLYMTPDNSQMDAEAIRSDLHTVLTQLLLGDTLAAEYLICNLVSSVYARRDGLSLGSLSVNLYNISTPELPLLLFKFLQNILPCSAYIPLTIELLNTAAFIPKKDYDTNRLLSGFLQLADDTHLLIDETVLNPGDLQSKGLNNLASLGSLAMHQELKYDFTYFELDFPTNVPVLVISEGKSIIPTQAPLKMQPEPSVQATIKENFEAAAFFLSGPRLEAVRRYLTVVRLRECDMGQTDFVGPSWVELRQMNGKLKSDDLHRLLVLSRILSLSSGRSVLSQSDWEKAVAMEAARRSRVPPT